MNLKTASQTFEIPQKTVISLLGISETNLKMARNGCLLPDLILNTDQKITLCKEMFNRTGKTKFRYLRIKLSRENITLT
jgi:hypothetical protein